MGKKYFLMKLFYTAILFIAIASCNNNRQPVAESTPQQIPKAFKEESSSLISKRSYEGDVIEELYNELLEKDKTLSALEDGIEKIKDNSKDSASAFNTFDSRNISFYSSATGHLGTIKDSVLKERIKLLVDNSLTQYKAKIAIHNNLLSSINSKDITLDDLHFVLKLTKTLAVMEKYQSDNLPSAKPLEEISKAYDKVISKTDALTKN